MNDHGFLAAFRRTAAWLVIWLTLSVVARAEMGIVQSFPALRTKMRNSLTVEVDTRGVVSNGYRCVRVKLSNTPMRNKPAVPVTADRRFRVLLEPSGMGHLSGVATSQIIEIPEKQASAEATIAIPSSGDWFQIQLTVYEGGVKLDDVSGPIMVGFWGMRGDAETLPTLLFLDYDVPDRTARDAMVGVTPGKNDPTTLPDFTQVTANIQYSNMGMPVGANSIQSDTKLTDSQIVTQAASNPRVQLISPAEMSRRWIELTCYDIAFISRSDLAKMKRQNAAQRQALVDWLHGGTALVVYDAGKNFEHLAEIEQLLDLRPLPDDRSKKSHGWSAMTYSNLHLAGTHTQEPVPHVGRAAGLGQVIAVASDNPFPGSSNYWSNLIGDIDVRHQHWIARHGMSYQMYNSGVWNWYIPGVGAAPVFSFLLLATLFAIVIGPVNYLFLGRIQRLYLLLVTVPVGALVVTLGLFAYAVLSDGLGVKARVRSFSLLDQKTGRSVSWSRQSYYASLVPSQGLKYPADAAVWPLVEEPQNNRPGGPWNQFAWEADGQRLKSGYLSSRRLTQFIVIRSGKTPTKLGVAFPPSGAPQVTSALGGKLQHLVLRDAKGTYYEAGRVVKPGESTSLKPISAGDAKHKISQVLQDHPLDFPPGYDPAAEERRVMSGWGRVYWPGSSGSPVLSSSILESNLAQLQVPGSDVLEAGTYFAVMDTNSDVPLGIAEAYEANSFHVVIGRW